MHSIRTFKHYQKLFLFRNFPFSPKWMSTSGPGFVTRQIYPYSNVKIVSNFHLKIKPYDVLDASGGNTLRVSLQPTAPGNEANETISNLVKNFCASIQIDDQNVVIDTEGGLGKQRNQLELNNALLCVIELPSKSNLKVVSERDVGVENMYSDEINVMSSGGNIRTKNIQSINVSLATLDGNIQMDGNTLAHKLDLRTNGNKNIHIRKVQGDEMTAISDSGTISTEACYSENSKFITQRGTLQLKNVHKTSEIYLLEGGNVDITGFHGVIRATTNGGNLNFQLTEVYGESSISSQNPISLNVNISDFVEKHTCVSITTTKNIILDSKLEHLKCDLIQKEDGCELNIGNRDLTEGVLTVQTNGSVNIGKLSWLDTIKFKNPAFDPINQ